MKILGESVIRASIDPKYFKDKSIYLVGTHCDIDISLGRSKKFQIIFSFSILRVDKSH